MRELISVIKETHSGVDWASIISAICSVISLLAIIILLKERREKKRPYLQASFELIRGSLTCIIIRNVGEVPAKLQSITFNNEFIKQFSDVVQNRIISKANCDISIYPKQQLVICLDMITSDVLKLNEKTLKIRLGYSSIQKKYTEYSEASEIAFGDYEGFLIYISEIDELKNSIVKIGSSLDKITTVLEKGIQTNTISTRIENCSNLEDEFLKKIAVGISRNDSRID